MKKTEIFKMIREGKLKEAAYEINMHVMNNTLSEENIDKLMSALIEAKNK